MSTEGDDYQKALERIRNKPWQHKQPLGWRRIMRRMIRRVMYAQRQRERAETSAH